MLESLSTRENFVDAVELAAMDVPRMYMERPKENIFRRGFNRLFAQPGRKPKISTISYRGMDPPNLMTTLLKNGEYRPDAIPLDTYELMRHYPVIKLALIARAAPTFTALREVKVDGSNPDINEFIKQLFVQPWLVRLAAQSIIPSYVFGCAPSEVVWKTEDVDIKYINEKGVETTAKKGSVLVFDEFRFIHPLSIRRIEIDQATRDYQGIVQEPPAGRDEKLIPGGKTFHYVNSFIWAGLWGESELKAVYPAWYYAEFFRALQADHLRFRTVPPLIGYAPPGVRIDEDGNEIDNMKTAGEILMQAFSNLVVVLPDERDDRGNQRWSYNEMKVGQYSDTYTKGIEELEVTILRGTLVPERTVTQNMAAVGSYNQADAHAERMIDMAKLEVDNFLTMANDHLIPKIIYDNFGIGAPLAKVYAQGMSEKFKEKLQSIILTVLQNDPVNFYAAQIAFRELLELVNIPINTEAPEGWPEPLMEGEGQSSESEGDEEPKSDNSDRKR